MARTNWGHSYVVMQYPTVDVAMDALAIVQKLKAERGITLKDAVVVYREPDGTTRMHQTVEPNMQQGAVLGTWLGMLAALFVAAAPLAIIGAIILVMAMLFGRIDRGIDNRVLLRQARDIKPGVGLLFLLVKTARWDELTVRMEPLHGEVVTYNLTPEAAEAFVAMTQRQAARQRQQLARSH